MNTVNIVDGVKVGDKGFELIVVGNLNRAIQIFPGQGHI
jgi:hypothetical protein